VVGKAIGDASDFYRLRLIRVDEGDAPDLEWRDDILYRRPPEGRSREFDVYRVDAVDVDDEELSFVLGRFGTPEEARGFIETADEDLEVMTKSEFERTYFTEDSPEDAEQGTAL
jgi:hypothetical protein